MAHLTTTLPEQLELGAVRRIDWGTEVVTTDGDYEVRNNRWASPRRSFEVSVPPALRAGATYLAVLALYAEAEGGLHSFNFIDWTDESGATIVPVRFASPLELTAIAPLVDHIETFSLIEVRL